MCEVDAGQAGKRHAGAQTAPWLKFSVHHSANQLTLGVEATLSGSLAVLVGPSGAGKTSLLRAIAGLMRPERGYATVAGTIVWDSERRVWLRPAERGCGLVMQRPALFPSLTAAENIAFGLSGVERADREGRVEEMASLFRIEALLSRRPAQLSGGEQQRVAVARTLAPRPRVLLLDEPFAGLNLELKSAILTDLERWLSRTETPAFYVTHDVAEAWRMGSRPGAEVLRMENGRIVAQGAAVDVLAAERAQLLAGLE